MTDFDLYVGIAYDSYVETAEWADWPTNEDGSEAECNGWAAEALASMKADVLAFVDAEWGTVKDFPAERVGHDFWLTRNHHGAGFWDGDYPDAIGKALTDAAHAYGSSDIYVGDDGFAYVS